ncbi:MAG: hypothetical protein JNL28_15000 [Planctomycetes bacterium]|nr:hypothetical protein [Planctomycetota bacterium]
MRRSRTQTLLILAAAGLFTLVGLAPQASSQVLKRWSTTLDLSQIGTGDSPWTMLVDAPAGRTYVGGWYPTAVAPDSYSAFVVAYDMGGQHLWTRSIPTTPGRSTFVYRLALHLAGGVVAVGEDAILGQSDSNVLVARVDAQGALAWVRTWDGPVQSLDVGDDVVVDALGSAFVAARTWAPTLPGYEPVLLRYDAAGNASAPQLLTAPAEMASRMEIEFMPTGDLLIATGGRLMRLLPNGAFFWSVPVNLSVFGALCVGLDGSAYVGTHTPGPTGLAPFEVTRYDPTGGFQWTRTVTDAVHTVGVATSLTCLATGEIVAAGLWMNDFTLPPGGPFLIDGLVAAFNPSGTELWKQSANFAGTSIEEFDHVIDAGNGRVTLQGLARDAQGVGRMCVASITSAGTPVWTVVPNPVATGGNLMVGVGASAPDVVIVVSSVADTQGDPQDLFIARYDETKPSFCHGDGSSVACPCGNVGAPDRGCPSSIASLGARLTGAGQERVSADSFTLLSEFVPNGPGLLFQGSSASDIPFGDGKLCATGSVARLGVVFASSNAATLPNPGQPTPLHVLGATSAGDVRHYQLWYRDADPGFCTPNLFNLTNAVTAAWVP